MGLKVLNDQPLGRPVNIWHPRTVRIHQRQTSKSRLYIRWMRIRLHTVQCLSCSPVKRTCTLLHYHATHVHTHVGFYEVGRKINDGKKDNIFRADKAKRQQFVCEFPCWVGMNTCVVLMDVGFRKSSRALSVVTHQDLSFSLLLQICNIPVIHERVISIDLFIPKQSWDRPDLALATASFSNNPGPSLALFHSIKRSASG
jgi:hypothetical protein